MTKEEHMQVITNLAKQVGIRDLQQKLLEYMVENNIQVLSYKSIQTIADSIVDSLKKEQKNENT